MHFHAPSLLVVLAAAVVAPLIGELTWRVGLSIVVLELVILDNSLRWQASSPGPWLWGAKGASRCRTEATTRVGPDTADPTLGRLASGTG